MLIDVMCINKSTDHIFYSNVEDWRKFPTLKDVFRQARKEYGRCVGRVYGPDPARGGEEPILMADTVPVGWIFRRTCCYKDSEEAFVQETWLTIIEVIPEQRIPQSLKTIAKKQAAAQ